MPKMQPPSDRGFNDLSVLVKMHQNLTIFQQNVLGRLGWHKMDLQSFSTDDQAGLQAKLPTGASLEEK